MSGRRSKDDRDRPVTMGRGLDDGYEKPMVTGRGLDDSYEKPVITKIQLDDDDGYDPDELDGYGLDGNDSDRNVRDGKGRDPGRRTSDDRTRSRRELMRRRKSKRLRERDPENVVLPEQNPERDAENGSRRARNPERDAENGSRQARNPERDAENGSRRTRNPERDAENGFLPEQDPESEEGISAETESEERERRPKKRRLTERERKVRQTIILLAIFAAACVALLLVVVIFRHMNKVEIPLTWSNAKMAYTAAGQSAMQTETAFSTDLCIGPNNVTREGLSLTGNERGALFSLDDRKVVFAKEMHEKIYPASITKLMTAILAFKSDKMDETVTIQWQDLELESGSQVVGLRIGDQVTMHDLMRGLLIHSGNDCAQAIARVVGGSQENFVTMMNEELKAIGATESHFTNPTGLHDENHYTSVYDIYLMLHEAMKNDEFISIIQIPVYDFKYYDADGNEKHVTLDSTDRYLTGQVEPPKDVTVLGGKTGTTSAAGNCLSLISQNAYGQFFISVVTGAVSKEDLYGDMNGLLSAVNV